MKLFEEFKEYENMWEAKVTALTEGIITHFCDNCKQTVQLDDNAMCPNCSNGISYLADLVAEVLSEDSKLYIIYNADKESVNKADLTLATGHINKGAEVVQVTKEFFSQLEPVIHDETPEDSDCGKVLLKNEPKIIQLILTELKHHTSILEKDLGKPTKQTKRSTSGRSNNQVSGQQKIDFDEEFKLNEDSSVGAATPLFWKNQEGIEIDLNDPAAIQQELDTHRQRYTNWLKKQFQKEPPKQTTRNGIAVSKKFSTLQWLIHQAKRNNRTFADELQAVIDQEVKRYKAELDKIKVEVANGNTTVRALRLKESSSVQSKGAKTMKLHEEFKLFENMWDSSNGKVLKTVKSNKLTESRSVADIEAEIEKLKQELAKAKVAEKRAKGKLPVIVFAWDMYIDPADKGTWTSAELYKGEYDGMVFETKEKAIDAAVYHLSELEDEGKLLDEDENPVDPDDYTIDTFVIGIEKVSDETLEASGLAHAAWEPCECTVCGAHFKVSPETSFYRCPKCHTDLEITHN